MFTAKVAALRLAILFALALTTLPAWAGGAPAVFLRGDTNSDTTVGLPDALVILNFLFVGGAEPDCLDSADLNDDGSVGLVDALYTLNFLFVSGPLPAAPFPDAGSDPTPDTLICCVVPDDLELLVVQSFPIQACVPMNSVAGATVCSTAGGTCAALAGCDFEVTLDTIDFDINTGVIDATGQITSTDFDVDAGILGSCDAELTMDYDATIALTTTMLPNGQLEITAVDSMFDISNIDITNCASLSLVLGLVSAAIETTLEQQTADTAAPLLELLVGNRICAP